MSNSNRPTGKKLIQSSSSTKSLQNSTSTVHRNSGTSIPERTSTQCNENSVSEKLQTSSSMLKKPISLIILEKYFIDIGQSISHRNAIEAPLLKKIDTMKEVLKDCLIAIPDMQLEVYVMMSTTLKDVQTIKETKEDVLLPRLVKNLAIILTRISENRFRNRVPSTTRGETAKVIEEEQEDLEKELDVKVSRVTARVLNIWKKIVSPQKEAEVICYCFLLLYSEIDKSIKVSPVINSNFDKPTDTMRAYLNNPGYVVTIIRHTKEYIQSELISVPIIKRIFSFLEKITMERIRNCDKTLTGYVLYELVFYSVMYYAQLFKEKTGADLLDRKINLKKLKNKKKFESILSENSAICTETDNVEDCLQDDLKVKEKGRVSSGKEQRAASQPPVRGCKVEKEVKKKTGLASLKEKPNKKKQKNSKDKEFAKNLKSKFEKNKGVQKIEAGELVRPSELVLASAGLSPITENKPSSSPKRSAK